MKRAKWTAWLATASVAAALASHASADELVLKFATLDVPQAHLNTLAFHPWAEKINKEANGLFRIETFDGQALANQGNIYNQVVSNVVQIGWGLPVLAGKFPLLGVAHIPFPPVVDSETASTALWRLYKTGLLDQEFDQVVPLKLIVFPQPGVQFRKQPPTLDGLNGLKMLAVTQTASQVVERLGGAPLSFRIDEFYETLQRGTADGVVVGWTAFDPFKLADVTRFHLDVPLGGDTGYVFMARKEWNSLPDGVRKILAENSGEAESRSFGKFWDHEQQEAENNTLKLPGHTLLHLTAAQETSWRDRVATLADAWAKSVPGGEKVLSTYYDLLGKAKSGS